MSVENSGGTNQVDVSADAIAAEWDRIVNDHEAGEIPKVEVIADGGMKFEPKPDLAGQLNADDKIAAAVVVIRGALNFTCENLAGLKIDSSAYDKVARAWAVLIVKHFKGGIFEFLAKYKDELAAAAATIVFVGALRTGVAEKKMLEAVAQAATKKEAASDAASDSAS